jgi:acyl dehydratase
MNTEAVGKTYAPTVYAVGREKIREYAHAVGETNPLHLDPEAARAAGHRDVVAPPMFCVV